MNKDKKKEKHQLEFAKLWKKNNYVGTAEMATGTGKNFAAFQCVELALKDKIIKKGSNILVLAEVTNRKLDFFRDLEKFDELYKKNFIKLFKWKFACYQSAYKWENQSFDLVIADEIHDSFTLKYRLFYENNSYNALIGLSARIERKTPLYKGSKYTKGDLLNKYCPSIYSVKQDEAIEEGLIADYEVIALYNSLDDIKKTIKSGAKNNPFFTTEKAAYEYYDKQFKKALFLPEGNKKKFLITNASNKRARILYDLPSKIEVIKELIKLPDRKILFGNSLDSLYKITPYVVSSKFNKEENDNIRNKFESGEINILGSFKKLKQGANLKNVKMAILHSYYSVKVDYIQRLGRILRTDGNKKAIVIILVTLNTQETKWFDKMTKNINVPIKGFHRLQDLINYIKTCSLQKKI